LPDALGGEPVLSNAEILCRQCHAAKSADDVRRVRKSDRQRDRYIGAVKPKGSIPRPPKAPRSTTKTDQLRALRERAFEETDR
jgi:hypothetical protein